MKKRKLLHLSLLTCLLLAGLSCSKKEEATIEPVPVVTKDCDFLALSTAAIYTFNNKKLVAMRRSQYYYLFTYNNEGKISDSKVYMGQQPLQPSNTTQLDTLAPFDRYFWEGNTMVRKKELKRDNSLRAEYLNTFDSQGRLTAVKILSPNFATTDYQYEYDSNGRLTRRTHRLTGTFRGKEYRNEIIFIESYEYGNSPVRHPESLLKDSGLPYDILGNDPWREWVAAKTIQQSFDYNLGRLEAPTESNASVSKTIGNIATQITFSTPNVAIDRTETYTINMDCR